MYQLSEMDTDTGLAIGAICITFGIGLICTLTILCRARCVEDEEEVIVPEVQEEDDYIIIVQEPLLPQ